MKSTFLKRLTLNRYLVSVLCMVLISSFGLAQFSVAQESGTFGASQYKLAPGDVIQISVFGEPDLSFENIRLNDAGRFSYPFLGEVNAIDLTAQELQLLLTLGLDGDYLINPKITVSILEYRAFFINGEVKSAGGYPWVPGLTLRQAVAMAGGLTERASQRRMNVVRAGDVSEQSERLTMDSFIFPGDIVTIDQGLF